MQPLVLLFAIIIVFFKELQIEIWSQWSHLPNCPAHRFLQRRHSRTLHTIFLSDGKLNATGFCSELSLPFTSNQFIFGILMAFNVGRSVVLFLFL